MLNSSSDSDTEQSVFLPYLNKAQHLSRLITIENYVCGSEEVHMEGWYMGVEVGGGNGWVVEVE